MNRIFLSLVMALVAVTAAAQTRAERIIAQIRNPKSKYVVVIALYLPDQRFCIE